MKAIEMDDHGGPEVPRLRDTADPVAGAGEIVVDIHAAAGAIRAPAITRMPLAGAAAAHELSKTGHVRGKIVLEVR